MTEHIQTTEPLARKLTPIEAEIAVESAPVQQGRSLVVTIGINNYVHWQKLKNAVQDAIGFQQTLIDKLGFLAPIPPLLDANATKDAIELLVDQLRAILQEDDRLVLFFAGHGHTRIDKIGGETVGETGFVVPVEARCSEDYWSDYVEIDSSLKSIAKLPAKHILVILDSCHSGFALGGAVQSFRDAIRYEKDLSRRTSRKVITSAQREQAALDGGPISGHSLFTGTLIQGLNWGASDLDGNGLITSSELGLFIQQKVGQASNSAQTPDFGAFHLDDRGEMVISLRNQSFDALKARAFSALQTGQFSHFKEFAGQVISLNPSSSEALYLEYRLGLLTRDFNRVPAAIAQLLTIDPTASQIPLSSNDLLKLQFRLLCWTPVLSLAESEFPVEIMVLTGQDKDQLQAAEIRALGETHGYLIEPGAYCQFSIENPTQEPVHVYLVGFDEEGRFQLETVWNDEEVVFNGLMPGETKQSYLFTPRGKSGMREVRFFSSPKRLRFFLFPASPDAYGAQVNPVTNDDLQKMKVKTIRYSLVNHLMQN